MDEGRESLSRKAALKGIMTSKKWGKGLVSREKKAESEGQAPGAGSKGGGSRREDAFG